MSKLATIQCHAGRASVTNEPRSIRAVLFATTIGMAAVVCRITIAARMFVAGDHKVGLERNQLVAESRNAHDVATRITLSLRAFSRALERERERERERDHHHQNHWRLRASKFFRLQFYLHWRSGGHPQHSRVLALLEIEDLSVRKFQRVVIHIWFHS